MDEKFNQRPYEISPYSTSDENGSVHLDIERNPMPSSEEEEGPFPEDDQHPDQFDYFQSQHPGILHNRRQSQRDRSFIPPKMNCPEKIIICLDISSEMDSNHFRLGDGSSYSPLMMTRRIIEIFLQTKHRMDRRHEYALVLLRETAVWVRDFVSDPKKIIDALDDISDTCNCDCLHLTSLFDLISEKVNLPVVEKPDLVPPPYILHVILLCGRSQYIPQLRLTEVHEKLTHSEYFFLDIFYLHEPPSEENKCEEVFDLLCGLDERGTSYIFEVSRNPTRLHDCMAKLLAHPLQRPLQQDTYYKLTPTHRPAVREEEVAEEEGKGHAAHVQEVLRFLSAGMHST